jgi:uncharacterized sulfatase
MFEESLRVPLLVRWPGGTRPGTVVAEDVSNLDIFPSILAMLGIAVPQGLKHDGMDFTSLLRGEKAPWRDAVYGEFDLHNSSLAFMRMIRTQKWKLVRFYFTNLTDELYDLEADPKEMHNLAYDPANPYTPNPAVQGTARDLQKRLMKWQRSIDDPILRPEFTPLEPANRRAERTAPPTR